MFPATRSSSLPAVSTAAAHGLQVLIQPTPRKDSKAIITEAPITPPMSPNRSEQDEETMSIDSVALFPQQNSDTSTKDSDPDKEMEIEQPKPMQQSVRHLKDEEEHLQKVGSLKLTDFEVRGTLGTGTFGRVLLVRLRTSPSLSRPSNCFALKILRKTEVIRLRQVEHVNSERYIMSRVRHPFIVDLYATFQDSLNIYMLLSYVPGGELFTHLRRAQRFTPDVTRFYLATIILALRYLHSFNIIYRDLKPENLMLDSRGYLRLTDFGFAKIVDDRTWTLCGTPEYLAPEIILNEGHGKPADWWACGILAYEMLVGYPPFFDETAPGIYEKILRGKIYWPRDIDRLSKDLVKAFLHPDRTKRLGNLIGGAQDVLDHAWFRGVDWNALERKEIRAPIVPHTTSLDDTRHFSHLPLPPLEEIPGLLREEGAPVLFDPIAHLFSDF